MQRNMEQEYHSAEHQKLRYNEAEMVKDYDGSHIKC